MFVKMMSHSFDFYTHTQHNLIFFCNKVSLIFYNFLFSWRLRQRGQRRRAGADAEAETAPFPDHLHRPPAGRAGEGLRADTVPGHLHQRGAGPAHQTDGGTRSGAYLLFTFKSYSFLVEVAVQKTSASSRRCSPHLQHLTHTFLHRCWWWWWWWNKRERERTKESIWREKGQTVHLQL